jgi:hypothetical protein
MKKAGRWVKWFVFNGVLVASIYYGLFRGVDGAANVAQFIVWFSFVVSLFLLSDDVVNESKQKIGELVVPVWLDSMLDVCLLAALAWHGWMWSAVAWVVHMILLQKLRGPITEKRQAA